MEKRSRIMGDSKDELESFGLVCGQDVGRKDPELSQKSLRSIFIIPNSYWTLSVNLCMTIRLDQ